MPTRQQTPYRLFSQQQLIERPVEQITAYAVDPQGAFEIDDAVFADIKQDAKGRFAEITAYIADTALLPPDSKIVEHAIEKGSTMYGKRTRFMLPKFAIKQLSLGGSEDQTSPAVAIRSKIYERSGIAILLGIERVNVRVKRMHYTGLSHRLEQKDPLAESIVCSAFMIAGAYDFIVNDENPMDMHRAIGFHMHHANRLVSQNARELGIPWIYRNFPKIAKDEVGEAEEKQWPAYGHQPLLHSGLGTDTFGRSTSPLRRVTDMVNQQNSVAAHEGRRPPYSTERTELIANQTNAAFHHVGSTCVRRTVNFRD